MSVFDKVLTVTHEKINIKELLVYTLIAALIGLIAGAIDALFGRVLLAITDFRSAHVVILVPFLAGAGLLILFAYKKLSPEAQKGMGLVFEVGFHKRDHIPKMLIPLIMVSTWLTHLFGGSAGREGVAVQIGATIGNAIGRKILPKKNTRIFLLIGMAAGFSGLFQTPLAATFFALEVLVAGSLLYEALIPCLAGAYVACVTSHMLGLEKFAVAVVPDYSYAGAFLPKLLLVAVIFGIVGGAFAYLLSMAKKKFAAWIRQPFLRILIMGVGLSVVLILLWNGRYCGLGTNLIAASLNGDIIYGYDFILKFTLTILTLAAGYQGGEVTPLFSIGATLGVVLASVFGLPVMLVAALGYAAVFGSATNTLFAPILIGIEVFGSGNAIPFIIVCVVAFLCNGNQCIYGAQRHMSYLDFKNPVAGKKSTGNKN